MICSEWILHFFHWGIFALCSFFIERLSVLSNDTTARGVFSRLGSACGLRAKKWKDEKEKITNIANSQGKQWKKQTLHVQNVWRSAFFPEKAFRNSLHTLKFGYWKLIPINIPIENWIFSNEKADLCKKNIDFSRILDQSSWFFFYLLEHKGKVSLLLFSSHASSFRQYLFAGRLM